MLSETFEHLSILTAHIAQKIIEDKGIDKFCISPCDLAVICHEKHYVQKDTIGKMLFHISEFEYMERRGEVFVLADSWRRMLPAKNSSQTFLREQGFYKIHLFQEKLAQKFIEIIKNETQKIDLGKLIYNLDAIDGSKGFNNLRSDAMSSMEVSGPPQNIFDFNFGLGYSATQLATLYQDSQIYSLQLNHALKDAFEYTILRFNKRNLEFSKNYPTEMINKLMREKVDVIYMFNPLGIAIAEMEQFLGIANQISKEGTKLLIMVPFKDEPKNTIISEWLGFCVEGMGYYLNPDSYRVMLPKFGFDIKHLDPKTNLIHAKYTG